MRTTVEKIIKLKEDMNTVTKELNNNQTIKKIAEDLNNIEYEFIIEVFDIRGNYLDVIIVDTWEECRWWEDKFIEEYSTPSHLSNTLSTACDIIVNGKVALHEFIDEVSI